MIRVANSPDLLVRRTRACQSCRSKKVKCDGVQPKCGICRSQARACTYAQDRRQTSRVSRETIAFLQTRLKVVEDSVQRLNQTVAQPNRGRSLSTSSMRSFQTLASRSPKSGTPCNYSGDPATHHPSNASRTPFPSHPTQVNFVNSRGNYEEFDGSRMDPSGNASSPVESHVLVQSQGRIAVYGPSSTFRMSSPIPMASYTQSHDATSTSAAKAASPSPPEKFDEDISAARCQLFANSALEVQKEWTYMTERKFDLDGLDFDTAWHLLQLHWNHHHMAYLLSYRPALMHSLATGGPYMNKLLLNAIYLASALNSDRKELYDDLSERQSLGRRFYLRFQQLLLPELEKSSIASAVGLLTVGSSLVSNGQQTAGWHYSGLGYRMLIDLGLHISPDRTHNSDPLNPSQSQIEFTHVDTEMSRRVFWGAYINDKFQSLYFGRPPALIAVGIEPSRLLIDNYEEFELWSPYVDPRASSPPLPPSFPKPAYTISTFSSLLELVDIMADIIEHFYTPKVHFLSKENTLREVKRMQSDLQSWEQRLPKHLLYHPKHDPVPPAHQFNPPMTFYMLHILLHRPFLAEGHLRHFELEENEPRAICTSAAFQIYELAKAYRQAFTLRRATYMFSYSLFSAASIIPLKSSGEQTAVDTMQKVIAAFFWTSLKELQNGANFGLRKPIMIIRSLFERAGLHLEPTTSHRNDIGHGLPSQQQRPLNQNCYTRVFENIDEQTLFQDLTSGSFDGVINTGDMVMDEDLHILYGLFR